MPPSDSAELHFDWNELRSLRIRARAIADGQYVGNHRSARRGVGVEFGGRRNYVPGDDLRWLDRHALMRHGKLLVREFETETSRLIYLVIDATRSMTYKSELAPVSKFTYAATLATALARMALSAGDPVALDWIGGQNSRWLPAMGGREAFDRITAAIETTHPSGQVPLDTVAFERSLLPVGRYARKGTVVVVLSDLLDLPSGATSLISELSSDKRPLVVVRLLDPAEIHFPFEGPQRFRALEGDSIVDLDAASARSAYLEAMARDDEATSELLKSRGGRLVGASTKDNPVHVIRQVVTHIGSMR